MHHRAHDEEIRERRGSILIVRGLAVFSSQLGLSGQCDVVEFRQSAEGHPLSGEEGLWEATPVEYKHGRSKQDNIDRLQLCAQAMCLEKMLGSVISTAFLYYGKTKSRERVELDSVLRDEVIHITKEMHDLYRRGHTPIVKQTISCRACSLQDVCLPALPQARSAVKYVETRMDELP